jgi:outer membrane lipoprotein-sorting protein
MRTLLTTLALAAVAVAPYPAPAFSGSTDARAVVQKMLDRNPSLESYRARVHVDVRMLNFPFLAPRLDGTSYYRKPDTYEVVFDRVPGYARGFQKLFDDVGDPAAWEKDQNLSVDSLGSVDGRPTIVLRLTKKIHSTILDHTLAYVDAASYTLTRMEWYYTSGGKITMSQEYGRLGSYWVPTSQHATIDIPHVHAVADAKYASYQTNIAVGPSAP